MKTTSGKDAEPDDKSIKTGDKGPKSKSGDDPEPEGKRDSEKEEKPDKESETSDTKRNTNKVN